MIREVKYSDLTEYNIKFEFHGRHQNPNGLKFYVLRMKHAGRTIQDYDNVYYVTFLIISKNKSNHGEIIEGYSHFAIKYNLATAHGLDETLIYEYLVNQGDINLRRYLNS